MNNVLSQKHIYSSISLRKSAIINQKPLTPPTTTVCITVNGESEHQDGQQLDEIEKGFGHSLRICVSVTPRFRLGVCCALKSTVKVIC